MTLKEVCLEIEKRYEVHFWEIGTEKDHVPFLIQSVPTKSASETNRMVKSITARVVSREHPKVKTKQRGGEFWTVEYFVNTVSNFGKETSTSEYV
jgi:putative transposase